LTHVIKPLSKPIMKQHWLKSRSAHFGITAIFGGVLFLSLASHIAVPMVPVPITMQTFAVTLIGALYGWRLGAITILAWLIAGAFGLPVFTGATFGLKKFIGPTAGYLFAFPLAAITVGWLVERGWTDGRFSRCLMAMLLGNAICLAFGASWLGLTIGAEKAVMSGIAPFLIGAVLKSLLGACCLKMLAGKLNVHSS